MKLEICECQCHVKGSTIRHVTGCCPLSGYTYINEDKSFDWVRLGKAMRDSNYRPLENS